MNHKLVSGWRWVQQLRKPPHRFWQQTIEDGEVEIRLQQPVILVILIGLLTSLVSAFYYLRVVVRMYFAEGTATFHWNFWTSAVAIFAALALLVFSFVPGWFFDLAAQATLIGG